MKIFYKNIPVLIILYSFYSLFLLSEEKDLEIELLKSTIQDLNSKKEINEKKLKAAKEYQQNLEASRERVRGVVEQVQKIQRQLPTQVNDVEIQQSLSEAASSIKIKDFKSLPKAEVINDFYFQKEYVLGSSGTFLQHLVFFEQISAQERILNVKSLKLVNNNSNSKGRYEILTMESVIESYRYNQTHDENNQLKQIEEKFK